MTKTHISFDARQLSTVLAALRVYQIVKKTPDLSDRLYAFFGKEEDEALTQIATDAGAFMQLLEDELETLIEGINSGDFDYAPPVTADSEFDRDLSP